MPRIRIEDLPTVDILAAEEEALIFGAGRRSFQPTVESLESREMMDAGLGRSLLPPLEQGVGGQPSTFERQLAAPQAPVIQVDYGQFGAREANAAAPRGAAAPSDPLINFHRKYAGISDLRKGDILLNKTKGFISETIQNFSGAMYNHAAIYVGNGMIVEAVSTGVRLITLKQFLQDDHIVRTMVVRNANLDAARLDAIANFAISKVNLPYNLAGLLPQVLGFKDSNASQFHRKDYYCSQLAAAAHASVNASPDGVSLDLSPGELANKVGSKFIAVGAVYDEGYHRSAREGRDCVNLDITGEHQQFLHDSYRFRIGASFRGIQVDRLTVDSTGKVNALFKVHESSRSYEVSFNNRHSRNLVDAWTSNLCRALYEKHFGSDRSQAAMTPTWVVERAVGIGVAKELNKRFAGNSLDGQKIDRFELVRTENLQSHLFEVEVRVWLNGSTAHANLRFSVVDSGLSQRDFSCGRLEAISGYQFTDQALGQLKTALKSVAVDSPTQLRAESVGRTIVNELNRSFAGQYLDGNRIDAFSRVIVEGSNRYEYKVRVNVTFNNGALTTTLEFTIHQGFFLDKCDIYCLNVVELGDAARFSGNNLAQMKDAVGMFWVNASDTADPITEQEMKLVQGKAEQMLQQQVLNELDRSGRLSPDAIVIGSTASLYAEDQIQITFRVKYNTTRFSTAIGDTPDKTSAEGAISFHLKAVWKNGEKVYEIIRPSLHNLEKGPHVSWQEVGRKLQEFCANHDIRV
jgi:hypothetical protein